MEIEPADRAGTGVEIFVMTPTGKVWRDAIKVVGHRTDAVRAIKSDQDTPLMGRAGECLQVQQLATGVEHGGQKHELHVRGHRRHQVLGAERQPISGGRQLQMHGGVETAQPQMALQRMEVGCKIKRIGENRAARRGRIIEGGKQLVQVHRSLAGDRDFIR